MDTISSFFYTMDVPEFSDQDLELLFITDQDLHNHLMSQIQLTPQIKDYQDITATGAIQ